MNKVFHFSQFTADCRSDDHVVCFEGKWSDGKYKNWKDFLIDTAKMRSYISKQEWKDCIIHTDDSWYFIVTYCALMQCKKIVYLAANVSPGFLAEIHTDKNGLMADSPLPNSISIQEVLKNAAEPREEEYRNFDKIGDDNIFYIYTSGSTGVPKAIHSRLKAYEANNDFNLNQWLSLYGDAKFIDTVSQCHSYGVAYTIQIPFAAGIPFRRRRIELPEEFEDFTDSKYVLVTVPAFLKRAHEDKQVSAFRPCWIYTSGGMLSYDVAKGADEQFGMWPVEMYGSTETCGVGWRQSKNGQEWIPFIGAEIWKTEDGCLGVKSPCVNDPNGFVIKDLVDILPDGRFLMHGRADSIVKIEEKRISLLEVENRLTSSGLVRDVSVVALSSNIRQYLAAVISLNKEGKEKFEGKSKVEMNRYFHDFLLQYFENVVIPKKWRFMDEIPMDRQGKKKKLEIQALFAEKSTEGK